MLPQSVFAANSAKYTMSNNYFNIQTGQFGDIYSLKLTGDAFPTNYVMNSASATAQDTTDHEWLGELVFKYRLADVNGVYPAGYTAALTNLSSDIRTMSQGPTTKAVTVNYPGNAANAQGIKNFSVTENYALVNDYLSWKITLTNTSSTNLELGDIGLPLPFNEYWTVPGGTEVYETQVVFHSFTGNNGSYINVTRPSGLGNSLLMTPDSSAGAGSGAGFEYISHWRSAEHPGSMWDQDATGWANGLNVFYINSNVIKSTNRGLYCRTPAHSLHLVKAKHTLSNSSASPTRTLLMQEQLLCRAQPP